MSKAIGILGGMGPMATADLYTKIVSLTKASCDREHIRVYIDSDPRIPDRTAAILSGGEDPVPRMLDALRNLERCGASCIIVPCNTAHYFLPQLQEQTSLPILSMLQAAAETCDKAFAGKTAAILATKGTLATGLYEKALTAQGVRFLVPDEAEQDALMRVIYDGVKAGKPAAAYAGDLEKVVSSLQTKGAEVFLLGCTELPLAVQAAKLTVPVVDPTTELAKAAIEFCGYEVV